MTGRGGGLRSLPAAPGCLQAYKHGLLHPASSSPRPGNTRLLQSAPAGPWPGNKLCQAGGGMTAAISWRPQSGTTRIPAWLRLTGRPFPSVSSVTRALVDQSRSPGRAGPGRSHGSAGSSRPGGSPLQSALPAAHPAASPSPTCTKFPTCLSVSDSSHKYLAAWAPAVLSVLCLLPCLPGGLCRRSQG